VDVGGEGNSEGALSRHHNSNDATPPADDPPVLGSGSRDLRSRGLRSKTGSTRGSRPTVWHFIS
jgi:hypothetical protein